MDSYDYGGYSLTFVNDPNEDSETIKDILDYLKEHSWIDSQTKVILIESNYLHKSSGSYIMHYTIIEILLEHYSLTTTARFLTPVYETGDQVMYTVLSTVAAMCLIIALIFDLKRGKKEYDECIQELIQNQKQKELERQLRPSGHLETENRLVEDSKRFDDDLSYDDDTNERRNLMKKDKELSK